jgi:hypothetical protein
MASPLKDLIQKVQAILADCMIAGLDSDSLTIDASEQSTYLIQRNLKAVDSQGELLLFLQDLAQRYPSFQKAYIYVKQQSSEQKDKQKLEILQAKLKSFTSSSPIHAS